MPLRKALITARHPRPCRRSPRRWNSNYASHCVRRSRHRNPILLFNLNLDLSLLSRSSRMILAHPHVLNMQWQEQRPPLDCKKAVPGHDAALAASDEEVEGATSEAEEEEMSLSAFAYRAGDNAGALLPALPLESLRTGPCLFKLWELIPQEAAKTVIDVAEDEAGERHPGTEPLPLCLREIGSTIYQYRPTGESADGLVPGLFAALPLTGFALIRYHDGSVNDQAREKILAGLEAHESHALPFYETDR